jgi:hypothetical protein
VLGITLPCANTPYVTVRLPIYVILGSGFPRAAGCESDNVKGVLKEGGKGGENEKGGKHKNSTRGKFTH